MLLTRISQRKKDCFLHRGVPPRCTIMPVRIFHRCFLRYAPLIIRCDMRILYHFSFRSLFLFRTAASSDAAARTREISFRCDNYTRARKSSFESSSIINTIFCASHQFHYSTGIDSHPQEKHKSVILRWKRIICWQRKWFDLFAVFKSKVTWKASINAVDKVRSITISTDQIDTAILTLSNRVSIKKW